MTECTHLDQVKNVKPHTHGLLREGVIRKNSVRPLKRSRY